MRKLLLALALLATTASGAFAQALTSQTASHADAATFLQAASNGATSCNTVSETVAQDTITITPPAGQYVYITGYFGAKTTDATGVTETLTVSTTNVTGSPIYDYNTSLSTSVQRPAIVENYNPPLKSTVAGTAVTFVPSATQSAHSYLCHRVAGYFAP